MSDQQLLWAESLVGKRYTFGHAMIDDEVVTGWHASKRARSGVWLEFANGKKAFKRYPAHLREKRNR